MPASCGMHAMDVDGGPAAATAFTVSVNKRTCGSAGVGAMTEVEVAAFLDSLARDLGGSFVPPASGVGSSVWAAFAELNVLLSGEAGATICDGNK